MNMGSLYQLVIAFCVMFIIVIWRIVEENHKRGFKGVVHYIKQWVDCLKPIVALIFNFYVALLIIAVIPSIKDWVIEKSVSQDSKLGELLLYPGAIYVFTFTAIIFMMYVLYKSTKQLFKYTEQEKQWQLEDKEKWHKSKTYLWFKSKLPMLIKGKGVENGIR